MTGKDFDSVFDANFELFNLIEKKDNLPGNEFIMKLYGLLNTLSSGSRVIFNLEVPKESDDGPGEELRLRLEKSGILEPYKNICQLIVQSPLIAEGPISAADTSRFNRYPFNLFQIKGQELLKIMPTGKELYEKGYFVSADLIHSVCVTNDKGLSLSPALGLDNQPIEITEWQLPDRLVE